MAFSEGGSFGTELASIVTKEKIEGGGVKKQQIVCSKQEKQWSVNLTTAQKCSRRL